MEKLFDRKFKNHIELSELKIGLNQKLNNLCECLCVLCAYVFKINSMYLRVYVVLILLYNNLKRLGFIVQSNKINPCFQTMGYKIIGLALRT